MKRPVIAGVDGSAAGLAAAEHAAAAAVSRSLPLHLVHGYLHPFGYGVGIDPYAVGPPDPLPEAERMLAETADKLRASWPGLTVETRQVAGGPAVSLVDESRHAELVVVGNRGFGGFSGLLLGSVSAQVAAHAHCPVLVVRPPGRPLPTAGPVIVGADGSAGCVPALDLATDEATRRKTNLVIIHAWSGGTSRIVNDAYGRAQAAATRPLICSRTPSHMSGSGTLSLPSTRAWYALSTRNGSLSRPARTPTWWWSARAGAVGSPVFCSARSARPCCTTRTAPCWSRGRTRIRPDRLRWPTGPTHDRSKVPVHCGPAALLPPPLAAWNEGSSGRQDRSAERGRDDHDRDG